MKRIAAFFVSLLLALAAGATTIALTGGGRGALSDLYTTNFPATENPISEGGRWTNGGATGLDWQNVRTSGGLAYGVGSSAGYDDCVASLSGFNATKHRITGTIHIAGGGYIPPDTQEVELFVAMTVVAHSVSGYEMDFGFGLNLQPVRWNGVSGSFDTAVFTTVSGATFSVADGDTVRVEFDSSSGSPVISLFKNGAGTATWVITDTTAGKITSGQPGIGFFARAGTGLVMSSYSLSSITAASL